MRFLIYFLVFVCLISFVFASEHQGGPIDGHDLMRPIMRASFDPANNTDDKAGLIIAIMVFVCCLPCILGCLIILALALVIFSVPMYAIVLLCMPCICIAGLVALIVVGQM